MTLVLGIDSSTQSTKALLVDADDGTVIEARSALHPPGTEVDPRAWLEAVDAATAGLIERADAISVGGQQHGMVALGADGLPVRDALLWNDTRSSGAARDLVAEMGGPQACADEVGSVLVASFTATKLRWLRDHEPEAAAQVTSVLLPHDYVSLHLAVAGTPAFTDRGDASGTGYFSSTADGGAGAWLPELAAAALGHEVDLPVVQPSGLPAGQTASGAVLAAGTGDNMGAGLGLQLTTGDVLISIGTSGVVSATSAVPVADGSGGVTGFADAETGWLPMITTMNAAGALSLQARWLGLDLDELAALALSAAPGSGGVTILPYYGGERTPNLPNATGTWTGLTPSTTRADLARAAFEAMICSLADAVDALAAFTDQVPERVLMVGGATRSEALRALAPAVLGRPVLLPPAKEYVALGASRQAAWALSGASAPPAWPVTGTVELSGEPTSHVRERYAAARRLIGQD